MSYDIDDDDDDNSLCLAIVVTGHYSSPASKWHLFPLMLTARSQDPHTSPLLASLMLSLTPNTTKLIKVLLPSFTLFFVVDFRSYLPTNPKSCLHAMKSLLSQDDVATQ